MSGCCLSSARVLGFSKMATVLEGAPESCPGPESEHAGSSSSCQGCPNQSLCSSGQPRGPDPDIDAIRERLGNVRHKVVVLSGKGGVGKSTVTAILARGLAADDNRNIAVMDIDVCGPSIPIVMGLEGEQVHQSGSGWSPVFVEDNLAVMSVGFLLGSLDDAVIWRGPRKNGIIKQFLRDVDWGKVDFMLIDTPPGTSDEHISIAQLLRPVGVDGAVLITTPQEVSLLDVRKEIDFCRKVGMSIVGVIENMSGFVCPNCKSESVIFPPTTGGASKMAEELNVPFLGKLPLDPRIGKCCDEGKNFLREHPDSPAAISYNNIVQSIIKHCETKIDC